MPTIVRMEFLTAGKALITTACTGQPPSPLFYCRYRRQVRRPPDWPGYTGDMRMEFIFLAVVAVLILLLALLGAFLGLRWLLRFWGRRQHGQSGESRSQMAERPPFEQAVTARQAAAATVPLPGQSDIPADAGIMEESPAPRASRARSVAKPPLLRGSAGRLIVVAAIAFGLLIPLLLVQSLVDERASLYRGVVRDISQTWGGRQQLTGPILLIPYSERQLSTRTVPREKAHDAADREYETVTESRLVPGYFVLLPTRIGFTGDMAPQERRRGIYRSLVYTADLRLAGQFTLPSDEALKRVAPSLENVDYARAYVVMGLSYPNALRSVGPLGWNKAELAAEPGTQPFSLLKDGFRIPVRLLPEIKTYTFSQKLNFNGSSGIRFTPVGGVTEITLRSPWPHPSFQGDILPVSREISDKGFTASWSIPSLARSYPNLGTLQDWPHNFTSFSSGVELYETATHYHLIERSVKYGILFIGLTFLALIVFELGLRACLHPVQYGLVGLAMVVFYLVLLSLSEHFAFLPSYAAASVCTILMIAAYAGVALRSLKEGVGVGVLLTALYTLLYAILQMEDYALLMGTALVLVALGALMAVSRNLAFEQR